MYIIAIFVTWLVAFILLVPRNKKSIFKQIEDNRINKLLGFDRFDKQMKGSGVNLNSREYLIITLGSIGVGLVIAYVLHNYFFIAVGMVLSYMLPRYLVTKLRRNHRQKILFELPDNLKVFTSKLTDFPSVLSALEQSVPDMHGETKQYFQEMLDDLKTGFSVESALTELKRKIRISRFDDFAEKLQTADEQGFHERAIQSLKETGREMDADNVVLKQMQLKAKSDMRNLYIISGMAWALPVVLSGANTDNSNIFLDTTYGQIYIVGFVIVTLYAIVKSDEYLQPNLDEL